MPEMGVYSRGIEDEMHETRAEGGTRCEGTFVSG